MSAIAHTQQAISRAVAQFATHGLLPASDMAARLSRRRRLHFAACLDTAGATPWPGLGLLGRLVDIGTCQDASTSARRTWESPARVILPRDSVSPLERSGGAGRTTRRTTARSGTSRSRRPRRRAGRRWRRRRPSPGRARRRPAPTRGARRPPPPCARAPSWPRRSAPRRPCSARRRPRRRPRRTRSTSPTSSTPRSSCPSSDRPASSRRTPGRA